MQSVYFIQAGKGGPIKIGVGNDVLGRALMLQIGNHKRLKILATMPGGVDVETAVQARFAEWRVRGEWFRATPELLSLIASSATSWAGRQPRGDFGFHRRPKMKTRKPVRSFPVSVRRETYEKLERIAKAQRWKLNETIDALADDYLARRSLDGSPKPAAA